jgi:hypothetical protein
MWARKQRAIGGTRAPAKNGRLRPQAAKPDELDFHLKIDDELKVYPAKRDPDKITFPGVRKHQTRGCIQ